ncbi:CLUMA_CG011409, isoform A [Clunio marinus]|uniref:CLUMA_CG011409, isoform A n=1 Tax=Clunio marinus TaxID=568069 RepID=A0A1J1ICS7_9DIPT|nr:CLUMA_CG011409, isoform A [Clunio marinus]
MKNLKSFINTFILINVISRNVYAKPNIVIIMADDLGFNDVSFHGSSEIPTPNIDALAYNGVILNRFYTPPLCTPSRSSFMTGKYPSKIGMHEFVIPSDEPWGLPLEEKIMPEYFKEAGYKTALIGKWHLGFYKKAYTPTMRGFDSFFGYLGPYIGYYDYTLKMHDRNYSRGYDMRRNLKVNHIKQPKRYATDLFTDEAVNLISKHDTKDPLFLVLSHLAPHAGNEFPDNPLEAPVEEIKKFDYIKDPKRRTLAAMISVMDQGIGRVVTALNDKGIMNETIILFYSDNGGPTEGQHSTAASNHPLRGQKGTAYEGGCRVVACIYSPLIKRPQRVSNDFMYVTDLLKLFTTAASIETDDESLDSVNQWETISEGLKSPRQEILYNIENAVGYSAIMYDGWKLINGSENMNTNTWIGVSGFENVNVSFRSYIKKVFESEAAKSLPKLSAVTIKEMRAAATVTCENSEHSRDVKSTTGLKLFEIINDPCEQHDLVNAYDEKVSFLVALLENHIQNVVPSKRKLMDPNCDPAHFNYTWTWWQEVDESTSNHSYKDTLISIAIAISALFVIFLLIQGTRTKKAFQK